ncbi:hypothetical protein T4B_10817 [Trichinella pseudospiralis]|uniref:Uncharacterized protein n=1 Tax=Trichinella pseudospiralis TaxID=6337 RepID=A0A0V1JDD9_TRIPS|nr:hypothetical protein T4B_10817 [Trichinella pseudospiralis]KRZ44484.1 hypothetical protein T4C_14117 [Trichinella pseudospiralis]
MLLELDVNLQMPEVFMTGMDKYNLKLLHSYLCCTVFPAAQKKFIYITFTTKILGKSRKEYYKIIDSVAALKLDK